MMTNEISVFEAQSARTYTSALPVVEVTLDVPGPSRHNDINSQTTYTPL